MRYLDLRQVLEVDDTAVDGRGCQESSEVDGDGVDCCGGGEARARGEANAFDELVGLVCVLGGGGRGERGG